MFESIKSGTIVPNGFLKSYNFIAMFEVTPISFSRISNVEETVEYETIQEGGINNHVHILQKPNTQVGTITFEKGVHLNDTIDYDTQITTGATFNMINVFVLRGSIPKKMYVLNNCFITKRSLSDFDANSSSLLIAKLEVIYSHMTQVALNV